MQTTLQLFSKLGWRIFPVNSVAPNGECTCGRPDCPNKGKHPRIKEWPENATTDLVKLAPLKKKWPDTNWAMACGPESGVWVLDVDEKNGGYESLAKLESVIGELPLTVRVKTGGGGLHIYFAWPTDGTIITNAVNLKGDYPGLDVRGQRGYVVLPPGQHKSGNRYDWVKGLDPESVSLAQAPQALIEVIKNAGGSRTYSDKPRDTRPWESVPNDIIQAKAAALCARICYFSSELGANDVNYEDWVTLASWAHAMTDDDSVFHGWSAADPDRYNKRDAGRKFRDTADMAPRSCHRAQSDHPLPECASCPFFDRDRNPSLFVREAYNHDLGQSGPFGAPPPTPEELEERRRARQQERDAYMDAVTSDSPEKPLIESTGTDGDVSTAPLIDVTEDDGEGSSTEETTGGDSGQNQQEQYRPNFRIEVDNITPLLEQIRALAQKLRDGADAFDLKDEIVRTLTAIHKLDSIKANDEMERIANAEKDAAKKYKRTASKPLGKKELNDAVKQQLDRETAEILTRPSTVGEHWPDAPEEHHELPLPVGYRYSDEGVEKFVSTGQGISFEEVSSQPTYVAGWREDIITGEIAVVVRTRTRNRGWIEVSAPPSELSDKRQTSALRNVGCDFLEESVFGKYLLSGYSLIRNGFGLEPELGTSRLGWHDQNDNLYFVFPEQSYGPMPIKLNGDSNQLQQDLSLKGDIDKECEAIVTMMLKYPKLAFGVGTVAASILMRPAKLSGLVDLFGFCSEYVSAATGTGKSTTVGIAIAIYGSPHSPRTFQTTQFAATQHMIMRSDLPIVWQEAQAGKTSAQGNNADPAVLLHILGDGGGKLMGTKEGGLRGNPQIFGTMMLANNENFVTPATAKQGELQRVFSFEPPYPPNNPVVKADQEKAMKELSNHHGKGGREMVRKLIELVDGSWTKLKEKVEEDYNTQFQLASEAIPADIENRNMFDRRAKIVALVRVGLKYLLELGYDMDEAVTRMLCRGIEEQFREWIKDENSQADVRIDSRKFRKELIEYAQGKTMEIWPLESKTGGYMDDGKPEYVRPHEGYVGGIRKIDGEYWLGLQSGTLMKLFKEHNRSHITLLNAWAKQQDGFVLLDEDGKPLQSQKRIGRRGWQTRPNMYFFKFNEFGMELEPEQIADIEGASD